MFQGNRAKAFSDYKPMMHLSLEKSKGSLSNKGNATK